ncbi:MAG: hypothetical protein ACM3PB_00485 [Betaproteobacteria bacterium]
MYLYGMAGIAFMALTVAAGWSVVCRLMTRLSTLEALAASTVVGIFIATWTGLAGYLVTGQIDVGIGLSALALLVIGLLSLWRREKWHVEKTHLPALAIIVLVSFLFMFLCLLNYYDGEYHVAYPLYGDAAYHSALVTSFSQGVNYPPTYPFMAGEPLHYTFLIDFYSAMLDRLGLGLQWSIVLPGILLLASLLSLLYFLGTRLTGRKAGGMISVALIVLSGGLGFIFALQDWLSAGVSLPDFLTNHYLNYTTLYEVGLVFTNFIDVILCERAALIGFTFGTLFMLLFYRIFVEEKEQGKNFKGIMLFTGIMAGLLPMFHMYSYASIMMAAGFFFLFDFAGKSRKVSLTGWSFFMVPAILLALPQLAWLLVHVSESFMHLKLGWMADSLTDIPWFWLKNMGVELLLLVVGLVVVGKEKLKFYLPFAFIFVIANVIIFQPWDYDNHSFFSFWLLASAPLMAAALLRIWDLRHFGKTIFLVLLVLAVLTGALLAYFMLDRPYVLLSKDSVHVADWIEENTPPDAVFLTGDVHNHPVTCLAGRKSFLGYRGWMYTHGVNTDERYQAVGDMFDSVSPADLYAKMLRNDIGYIYIGPEELNSQTYQINRTLFDSMTPIFNWTSPTGSGYRVYQRL